VLASQGAWPAHHSPDGPGAQKKPFFQHCQVREVDDVVSVQVRPRVRHEEDALHLGQIPEVHDAVVVEVAIASVAVAGLVGIELVGLPMAVQLSQTLPTPSPSLPA